MPNIKSREKTTEQLKEDLRKTREELAIQKWGLEKTLEGMRVLVKELSQKRKEGEEAKVKDEALLESIGEGVVATDKDGRVILANKVAEGLLGLTSQELLGKFFIHVIPMQDAEGNQISDKLQPITLALSSRTTTTTTYYFVRENGTKFPVAIIITPVIIDSKTEGAMVVFRDITKEKELEKLRTDFLSLASHQLRTPLSGTKWLVDTIRREILGSMTQKQKEYLDFIYQINERMIKLVSEMLNVLMLDSGVMVIKKEDISVSKLYRDLFLMMETASRNRGVTLRNALTNNTPFFIQSDFQALRSILENFVSNAINYSRNGQEVVLDAKEETDAIVFSIKDSGIGIPKEEQKRVFERFYRASNAKRFKPDGTGLGLYTTSILAKKLGVETLFESEEGKGSTFYLRVPKSR